MRHRVSYAGTLTLTAAAVVVLQAPGVGAVAVAAAATRLPVYEVSRQPVTRVEARRLARALGLRRSIRSADGSVRFVDADLLGRVPVKPGPPLQSGTVNEEGDQVVSEEFDFEAIRALRVLSDRDAGRRATLALRKAGLSLRGSPQMTNSRFSAFAADGTPLTDVAVDTQASWRSRLSGRPLIGPGAKAQMTFDGEGRVTHLLYTLPRLRKGDVVPLISAARADRIAAARFRACPGTPPLEGLRLRRSTVYWAPAPDASRVRRIVPHYQYDATATIGGQTTTLETIYLPAVATGRPTARLTASARGAVVSASTAVRGGRRPYTYHYESCVASLTSKQARAGSKTSYEIRPRAAAVNSDTVSVLVTDADGLTTQAQASTRVDARPSGPSLGVRAATVGPKDTGSDWVGASQGLPNTASNVADFLDEMSDISTINFSWGNSSAYNSDIVDPAFGGNDVPWGDNVDLLWFQGHGNPDGVRAGDSVFVPYQSVRLGNNDLDWIVVHSCQVLAPNDASGVGVATRWIQRFAGLRIMFGFSSNASNVDGDGNEFGDNIADDHMRMRTAYVDAVVSEQPSGKLFAYTGPIGPNNTSNLNDYYHGIGTVTPKITTFTGYWYYNGYT